MLEHYICIEINEKVKEGASELENAVFDRYDFVHILGEILSMITDNNIMYRSFTVHALCLPCC